MNKPHPAADVIVKALVEALEPLDYTYAMWQGGAAAFDRLDEWSDIDLQLVVDDDDRMVAKAFEVVEQTLTAIAPIELKYEIPQPSWHGHAQAFYRLEGISKFLLVDLAVMKLSSANKFLEPEIHGQAVVLFDKSGVVPASQGLDSELFQDLLKGRVETLRVVFDLYQVLVLKELERGNAIEALSYYYAFTLRPLVELLRIQLTPYHYNFYTRYVYYELPAEVISRLEKLFFIRDTSALTAARNEAQNWFERLLNENEPGELPDASG